MSINVIAESITLERCKEILFLYALSGSDYMTHFFQITKVKFWNPWLVNQDVPETFIHLGDCPSLSLKEGDMLWKDLSFLFVMMILIAFQLIWLGMKSSNIAKM